MRYSLDYEKQKYYKFQVEAADPLTRAATVEIHVENVVDIAPQFALVRQEITILENVEIGTKFALLEATNLDAGNAKLIYAIQQKNIDELPFRIDESGWLIVVAPLDREKIFSYDFIVVASNPPLQAKSQIAVRILDVNDSPPKIDGCPLSAVIQEGTPTGRTVAIVDDVFDADDPDAGNGPPFQFDLIGMNSEDFSIDNDGNIFVGANVSAQKDYKLVVKVTDAGRPPLSSECPFEIRVIEDSKFAPILAPKILHLSAFLGELPPNVFITQLNATDFDPLDKLSYNLVEDSKTFDSEISLNLNSESGELRGTFGTIGNREILLNISVSDGKFTTFSNLTIIFHEISAEMIEQSVAIRFLNVSPEEFLANYFGKFSQIFTKNHAFRAKNVQIISIQSVGEILRSKRKRSRSSPNLDVIFVAEKGNNGYFKAPFIRKKLSAKIEQIELELGLKISEIEAEKCSKNLCVNGFCKERIFFDALETVAINSPGIGFVTPKVEKTFACQCSTGFGGIHCNLESNKCSRKPCAESEICIPEESPVISKKEFDFYYK